MKYFTFTARCTLHNCDLEYIEPEGFEPDLVPIEVRWDSEGKEYELDYAARWQCPVFVKDVVEAYQDDESKEVPQEDTEREHWEFIAQNSETDS